MLPVGGSWIATANAKLAPGTGLASMRTWLASHGKQSSDLASRQVPIWRRSAPFVELGRLQRRDRNTERLRGGEEAVIIGRKLDALAAPQEERHRGKVQRIERPHRNRKRLKRALQDRRRQLNEREALNEDACLLSMRPRQIASVEPGPDLIFQQPARDQRPIPQSFRRRAILGQKLRRATEVSR